MKLRQITDNFTAVTHDSRTWYFSYETCVAYEDELVCIRLDKPFSATTKRHINKTDIKSFTLVSESEFQHHTV